MRHWIVVISVCAATGCSYTLETALEQLLESRRLAADLLVQFTKTADAGNRAVMADSEAAAIAFATEAGQATQAIEKDRAALAPMLMTLGFSAEAALLAEFNAAFSEYRTLDETILGLAVEHTNLKAQRLSFGPARDAADALKSAVETIVPLTPAEGAWHARALAATAVTSVREIQVLQAPHIAEADDAVMTRIETQMATAAAAARNALEMLGRLAREPRTPLTAATAALDRFMSVNAEIVTLSRRNSNVHSLALSLGQKRMLTAGCEAALLGLQDALAKREFGGRR